MVTFIHLARSGLGILWMGMTTMSFLPYRCHCNLFHVTTRIQPFLLVQIFHDCNVARNKQNEEANKNQGTNCEIHNMIDCIILPSHCYLWVIAKDKTVQIWIKSNDKKGFISSVIVDSWRRTKYFSIHLVWCQHRKLTLTSSQYFLENSIPSKQLPNNLITLHFRVCVPNIFICIEKNLSW